MTVQDFIVNYSATFQYLHDRFGKAAVIDLWEYLGETGTELYDMVKEKGMDGYYQYFYGEKGTCTREDVIGGVYYNESGVLCEHVDCCPSVSELEARGKRPYRYYCEHCYWLYHKAVEENGFGFDVDFELQPWDEGYAKHCSLYVMPKEDTK